MSTLDRAIQIAIALHKDQKDKAGAPYILHPFRVMARMEAANDKIAAVLHDVLEDSTIKIDELRAEGFSEDVLCVVETLTHRKDETYTDYIERIAKNSTARKIKIADLQDNMDMDRIKNPTVHDFKRTKKYRDALTVLDGVESSPDASVKDREEQTKGDECPDSVSSRWDLTLIHQYLCEWFAKGRAEGFKYLLICQDTFDIEDENMGLYPYYSRTLEEAREFRASQLRGIDLLVEVLDLDVDLKTQLSRPRIKNLEDLESHP